MGHERVEVDLARVGDVIDKVVVAASADGGTFAAVQGLNLQVLDAATSSLVARFDVTGIGGPPGI